MKKLAVLVMAAVCLTGNVAWADLDAEALYKLYAEQYKGVYGERPYGCVPKIVIGSAEEIENMTTDLGAGLPIGVAAAALIGFHLVDKKRITRRKK